MIIDKTPPKQAFQEMRKKNTISLLILKKMRGKKRYPCPSSPKGPAWEVLGLVSHPLPCRLSCIAQRWPYIAVTKPRGPSGFGSRIVVGATYYASGEDFCKSCPAYLLELAPALVLISGSSSKTYPGSKDSDPKGDSIRLDSRVVVLAAVNFQLELWWAAYSVSSCWRALLFRGCDREVFYICILAMYTSRWDGEVKK